MRGHTKAIISTYQVEIMKIVRPPVGGVRRERLPRHGILRTEPGLPRRAGDRPRPAATGSVLHRAVPGAARRRRAHVRTRPIRLVADGRWPGRSAAVLL